MAELCRDQSCRQEIDEYPHARGHVGAAHEHGVDLFHVAGIEGVQNGHQATGGQVVRNAELADPREAHAIKRQLHQGLSPTYKAVVERLFGTLNSLLNEKLPGGVLKPEVLREFGYVTLPCEDERYAQGVSLWHHRRLQEWAVLKGEEFSSEDDRLLVRAKMIRKLEDLAPTLKGKERRAMARLLNSPKIQSLSDGGVALAYAPSRHDGLAPIIEHDLLAPVRSDEGRKPSRPAPTKKRKPPKPRRAKAIQDHNHLKPQTGDIADFSVDLSSWKEIDL